MSKIYNMSELVAQAEESQSQGGGDLVIPEHGSVHEVTVRYVKTTEANYFELPEWWLILESDEGVSFGFSLAFTGMDFVNKLTIANLRALGVPDAVINNLDPEVVASIIEGKRVTCKVKWGKNKKKPEYPYQNHTLHGEELDIPEPDDDDDDY